MTNGPLAGVTILDMSRLAPGPYATMLLADLGADVIAVGGGRAGTALAEVSRGKRFISLDLKSPAGQEALRRLVRQADVVVEGFRPGVADRLGAGYDDLRQIRPDLIYCSLTGYGQDGPFAQEAGHDINYISVTGVLGSLGPAESAPRIPLNLVADFAGGSLQAAMGIVAALFERERSGQGQFIDVAMIDGVHSMMAMFLTMWRTPPMPGRGSGLMDGTCPFYRSYECADGRFVAVGALERQFFESLWAGLDLGEPPDQYPRSVWPQLEATLEEAFKRRTRDEWAEFFVGKNACVTPVLYPDEVAGHAQVAHRHPGLDTQDVPAIPRLSRTGARAGVLDRSDQTADVLTTLGMSAEQIAEAHDETPSQGLDGWPDM